MLRRTFSSLLGLFLATACAQARDFAFSYENGFILLSAEVMGHPEPLTFLVDSGASASVMNLFTVRRLKMPLGKKEMVQGVGAQAEAYALNHEVILVGDEPLMEADLAADLSTALPLCGRPIDGLIGISFFAERVVQIDYAAKRLRVLEQTPRPPEPAQVMRLPLRKINGVFCAGVCVNDSQPRWTRLDTGCNDALHWVVPQSGVKRPSGNTIGFIDTQQNLTRTKVRLGGTVFENVQTSLHGRPLFPGEAGLLGNGLLQQYTVTIDGPQRELWLQRE